ncbi:hypothetical protein SAMN04488128_103749 [Chitinophaga eiseniae]|uniref:Uncharacterized protein n=1 Tax=Chitinophaga eiseniae TaxID=634771 RepID=A0A1T4SXK3_9BACT|nr:hypothetical protein [Chitinophaga eiseniae]SKA32984.1 hypothetical protein SAMN04488128_103749 [Chitinophaga eiseniae]
MRFVEIIRSLDKFISFIKGAVILVAVGEAILVILIGVVSNGISSENQTIRTFSLWSLIFLAVAYLFLLVLKTIYNKTFPGSIVNELKSERELTALKKDADRQKTISDFLVTVMGALNGQTCALNYGDETHLCDTGIKDGIYELVKPAIDNINYILDTTNTGFTTGVYLQDYCALNGNIESGIITITDQLGKSTLLAKNLLDKIDARGEELSIQTAIRESLNDIKFVKRNYSTQNGTISIFCTPIPLACNEEEVNGVFFVIGKAVEVIPADTELNLSIFNRVISNWLYRYNECVSHRVRTHGPIAEEAA